MTGTYTARANRDEHWWTITVDEVPGLFTQTRRLDQITEMVRDALTLFPEIETEPDLAVVVVIVEPEIATSANNARKLREEAERSQAMATQVMTETAKELSSQGLPYRDIGHLLGVSFQQAQKLASA